MEGARPAPVTPQGPQEPCLLRGHPPSPPLTLGQRPAPQGRAAQSPLKAVGRLGADKGGGKCPINCKRQDKGRRAVGAAASALWHRTKGGPGVPALQTLTCASPGAGVLGAQAHSQKGRRQPGSPSRGVRTPITWLERRAQCLAQPFSGNEVITVLGPQQTEQMHRSWGGWRLNPHPPLPGTPFRRDTSTQRTPEYSSFSHGSICS